MVQLDEMRMIRTRHWLRQAVLNAQVNDYNPVGWHMSGLDEVEALVRALETGGSHPSLERWKKLNAVEVANRAGPDEYGRHFRRMVLLFCTALRRTENLNKREAREAVAERLYGLPQAPSAGDIKNWQAREQPFDPARAETIITIALKRGPDQVTTFFVSVIAWFLDPRWMGGSEGRGM
jgi:hypothetical protein